MTKRYPESRPGIPDFIDSKIDVDTLIRYMDMTQKKAVDSVDKLIESGDIPTLIARYVELTLQTTKIREYLLSKPDIAQALGALIPSAPPIPNISPWNRGGTPQATMALMDANNGGLPIPIPGAPEPLGTIHKDVPVTYDYPMEEYLQQGNESKDNVMRMLSEYQGIDPNGEAL